LGGKNFTRCSRGEEEVAVRGDERRKKHLHSLGYSLGKEDPIREWDCGTEEESLFCLASEI